MADEEIVDLGAKNLKFAFVIDNYKLEKPLDNSSEFNWEVLHTDGESEKKIGIHRCTDKDLAEFYEPSL